MARIGESWLTQGQKNFFQKSFFEKLSNDFFRRSLYRACHGRHSTKAHQMPLGGRSGAYSRTAVPNCLRHKSNGQMYPLRRAWPSQLRWKRRKKDCPRRIATSWTAVRMKNVTAVCMFFFFFNISMKKQHPIASYFCFTQYYHVTIPNSTLVPSPYRPSESPNWPRQLPTAPWHQSGPYVRTWHSALTSGPAGTWHLASPSKPSPSPTKPPLSRRSHFRIRPTSTIGFCPSNVFSIFALQFTSLSNSNQQQPPRLALSNWTLSLTPTLHPTSLPQQTPSTYRQDGFQ